MQLINLIIPFLLIAKSSLLSVNSNTQCNINHPDSAVGNIFYLANNLKNNTVCLADSYPENTIKTTIVNSTNKCSKKTVQVYKNFQCSYECWDKPYGPGVSLYISGSSPNSEYSGDFCSTMGEILFANNYVKNIDEPLVSCYTDNNTIINSCAGSAAGTVLGSKSLHGLFVFDIFVRVEKPCHRASINCNIALEDSTNLYCDNKPVYKYVRLDFNYTTQKLEQGCPVDYNTQVNCYIGSKILDEEQVNSNIEEMPLDKN
jgi:hypothetical protein